MEASGGDGRGEDVALRPQPSHEGDSDPSDGDEDQGQAKVASESLSAVPKGCEAVGSTMQQETRDHMPSCANREGLCSEPEPSPADALVGDGEDNSKWHLATGSSSGHKANAPGHTKQVGRTNQENLNRTVADDSGPSNRVGGDDGLDKQALGTLLSGHTSAGNKSQGEWICQPSSYLFGARHPLQDAMSLEFVAVLSQPCNLNKKDKICIVFYKGQGHCEEFANMERSSTNQQVISGSARIPVSCLQQGAIFYKYALVDTYSQKRACNLEHIPLENFSIPKTFQSRNVPLFRVLKIPKEEIRVGGTWTIFEQLHCHFPRTSTLSSLVSKGPSHQMEVKYLENCFFAHTTSWKSLEAMERKLDRYKESSSVCLGDPEERKHFEVTCQSADVIRDSVGTFIQTVIEKLDTSEHKLPQLLFVLYASFKYGISLPSASIAKAEKLFEDIGFLQEEELRGKSKYFPALKELCLKTTDGTLWIWLVPLLFAIKKTEDAFAQIVLPLEAFKKLRKDKEKQRKVLKMVGAHRTLITSCPLLAKKVFEMLALKNFVEAPLADTWQVALESLFRRIIDERTDLPEGDLNMALKSIATWMETWVKDLCFSGSSKAALKAIPKDEVMQCLNLGYLLLKYFLQKQMCSVSFSNVLAVLQILGTSVDITELLEVHKEFQLLTSEERFEEFSGFTKPWLQTCFQKAPVKQASFQKSFDAWQQLLSVKILCPRWTKLWRGLLQDMFKNWLEKVEDKHLIDFFQHFLKMDKSYDIDLESCFTNHIIQCIRGIGKSKEPMLKSLLSVILKTRKPSAARLLSVMVERMFSVMETLRSVTMFDENTGPVLANLLNKPEVCDLLSVVQGEGRCHFQLSNDANVLLDRVSALFCFVGRCVLLGDLPCSILESILKHREQFMKMLCTCDSSFTKCLPNVLEVRKREFEQLEEQKKQRHSFLCLCRAIEDVIKVDTSIMEKSIMDNNSFKDQTSVRKFLIDGTSELESHVLDEYQDMMQKLDVVKRSQCFQRLLKRSVQQIKATASEDQVLSIADVEEKIYKPAMAAFGETYQSLKNFSITLGTVKSQFKTMLGQQDQLRKEFEIMEESEGTRPGKAAWIPRAVERIENYLTLSEVVTTAKVIEDLRQMLQLKGDFQVLSDLAKYDKEEFKKKRLDFMTQDLMKVKKQLSDIPQGVLDFVKELLECSRRGFTAWIKTIIKDKTEIPVFVELASISAGENDIDIDRVGFFRDAMAASAPIILDLSPTAGFDQFSEALSFIKDAVAKDRKLPKKLRDSFDEKWLKVVHESHGSVEQSSISQARSINRNGKFTISAPAKCKATLENCVSLRLLPDCEGSTSPATPKDKQYSFPELRELQNKLMLITTKVEQGREETNRFLEVLEKVETIAKLYLELLSVGNILFIDWKADIYCRPQQHVKVYTEFGIAGILVQSTRPLLEELGSLSKAMEHCLAKWKKYLETQRDTYYHLNLFTAHQLFYLCSQLARVQKGTTEPQVLIMLSVIKHDIRAEDIQRALRDALMTPLESIPTLVGCEESVSWQDYIIRFPQLIRSLAESGYNEAVAKAALQSCLETFPHAPITEQMLMDFAFEQGEDKDLVEQLSKSYEETRETFLQKSRKFKTKPSDVNRVSFSSLAQHELSASFESLPSLYDKVNLIWDAYCKKLPGLVSDKYIGLDVFGETLKRLAALESTRIERSLPVGFEVGKPILITCKEEDMLPNMLFLYRHTEMAPLPSYDEVLVCTPNTHEEEVELLVRRALAPGSQDQKIYCLLGADKLVYKVSKQLEFHFFRLVQSSSIPSYRFIIFCNAKAPSSYVITAFDAYKMTFPCYSNAEIQTYLKMHLKVPSGTSPVTQAFEEPHQQNMKLVFSKQAGMGKSLFVTNTIGKVRAQLGGMLPLQKTIRLMESDIDFQFFVEELFSVEESATGNQPSIFHIDVSPVVSKGLYRLLIELCILRHIQRPDGFVWKCKASHLYLIEYLARGKSVSSTRKKEMSIETEKRILDLFPTVECISPLQVLNLLEHPSPVPPAEPREEQFDRDKLNSEVFQRSYQYLIRYKQKENLDYFTFVPSKVSGAEKECLQCLMEFCGRSNPSWTELSNFTHFLNFQLQKCEKSIFCSPVVGADFSGFKTFVIKFMITMSKDFAMPSLNVSDESVPREEGKEMDDVLRDHQLRRRWEQESHPYVVFHAEGDSMEFLGFHINKNLDAIDAYSKAVLETAVLSKNLYITLKLQNVPFNKEFEKLSRPEQLEALCRVFGVKCQEDPDPSYQLTLDNTMKMLAIHLRFQCGIPVIIMGETGCGKTKLVQFMSNLQRAGRKLQNMVVVRVHGSTTSKAIWEKVRMAVELARFNEEEHNVDTVLFFDEANTSEAIFAIKEVLCDRSVNGKRIPTDRLKVVAACNPYRRHTKATIEKLEKAGLGYRVRSEDTPEKLGYIPLRQLVYRVQPLPPSLLPLVWDFGELNEKTQSLYIREIVKSTVETKIPAGNLDVFTNVISASQKFLRGRKDECRVASLRDIERCMQVLLWFYDLRELLFHEVDKKRQLHEEEEEPTFNDAQRALVLSVGVCYYVSLENRQEYLEEIAKCFFVPASRLQQEIELCQEVFLDNITIPKATACNNALRENIFMMIVCMDLRVPLFLVGKPGSSKSLSKTIAVDAMKGPWSSKPLFKACKEVQLISFQCSPHSKPEGIISTFQQCAQFQKGKNLNEFASVVLLNEIGLAEDSPDMPLKALHPLLEDGCVDDEDLEAYKKVGFMGISNWALDPAKMNRGLLVFRTEPNEEELVKTAKGICADQPHGDRIEHLFPILAKFYLKVLQTQPTEFFGLRDFYSLIKTVMSYTQDMKCSSQEELLIRAIQRNFGGSRDIYPLGIFCNCTSEFRLSSEKKTSCIRLLEENMAPQQKGAISRYLLLLTTNNAAFQILQMMRLIDTSNCDVIFGSGFPQDQDYSQVCRSVNRVKTCMEIGRPVILLNIQNLYESLYDTLNQCFVSLGDNFYVDLGLGTHAVKSRVKEEFRLVVIEEQEVVYRQFPTPLLSRLEKHCLNMNTILNLQQQDLRQDLNQWVTWFVSIQKPDLFSGWSHTLAPEDVFIGFSGDTAAAIVLESSQHIHCGAYERYGEPVLSAARSRLVECATPDSILRLKSSILKNAEQIQDLYFIEQKHNGLASLLGELMSQQEKGSTTGLCLQVSTHARLLNQKDVEMLRKMLDLPNTTRCLFLSQFDTEHAFRQDLRNFFHEPQEASLLLVQFHFDEPQSSKRLLACAKYCITDERQRSASPYLLHVVLITKVPRVLGGCRYLAFDSGDWKSIHLDELMPPENFKANLGQLSKMTIAEIFTSSSLQHLPTGSSEDSAALGILTESGLHPEENPQFLNVDAMIKGSIQKAVVQLEDKRDNSQRPRERVKILHNLLFHPQSRVSSHFMTILRKRVCYLLHEREKSMQDPKEWVFHRAFSTEFILEDTSFRQALWTHLEGIVANIFAQILAVVDANNNLDLLLRGSSLPELWLQMFQEETFLKIKYTNKAADAKFSVLSMTEDPNISLFCQFPFSWVLKAYLDNVWEKVYHMKDQPQKPTEEVARFYQTFIKNILTPDSSNPDMLRCYANDFLRMAFPGQDFSVYEVLSKVFLATAGQLCSSLGLGEMDFSPVWLHMDYFYLRDDYQLFVDIAKSNDTVISELQAMYEKNPPEMFVTLDALNILLENVQPCENRLLPFDASVAWLKSVKSIKPWMEWISEDNYQLHFYQKKQQLLENVLHRWHCTNIVYMLIDHLLHNETQMEEKLLRLVVKQFIFLWNRLYTKLLPGSEPEKTFDLVVKVLKKCNENADMVYLVKGVKECKSCLREITDPAELPCGHIFCTRCILDWDNKQCKICKEEFPEDYTPTASEATREAVACHNKFRRKCNSFFVEFISTYFLGDRQTPSAQIIQRLLQFVASKPNPEHQAWRRAYKPRSELSPFEECMDTSPTIQSSLLKLLLRCGFNNVKVYLEEYLSQMEEKIMSHQSNIDHFYFMVVHCLEQDFMYSSSEEDINQLAEHCLSTADIAAFCKPQVSKINTLEFIAQLRLSISHVATVLGRWMLPDPDAPTTERTEKEQDLVKAMKKLVAKAPTPWPQVFLIRNLCDLYGFTSMWKILQVEKWILPQGVEVSQCRRAWSNTTLMFCVLDKAQKQLKSQVSTAKQSLTSVMRQMESILHLPSSTDELPGDKLMKIVDALGNGEDPGLQEVVFHTALTLALFPSHITHFLRNISFKPKVVMGSYFPTMPGDLLFDEDNWKIGETEKIWSCQCGLCWVVTNCGLPMEVKKCKCGAAVGGTKHRPEKGFMQKEVSEDTTEKGYILESPISRMTEPERCLSPACVALARALLHSSLLLGIYIDKQAILDLMREKPEDVEKFFWGQLKKDLECLAEALSRNMEDALLTVHLFLQHLCKDSSAGDSTALGILREKKDREEWETLFKALAQPIFQELEHSLNSIREQRMNEGPQSSSLLLKIARGQTLPLQDLPQQGLINQPCMWQLEQKVTIQTLMHFLQLEGGEDTGSPYPILLELLSKLENIQHVQHLPDIFRLQNALIHFFQNSHKGEHYTVQQFLDQPELSEDQRLAFSRAIETIQKVWSNIKMNPSISGITVLPDLLPSDISTSTAILQLLPTQPSISRLVARFLIQLQNSCVDTAARVTKERQRSISAEEVKPSSVLTVTKSDLVTMALTNLQYEIDKDGTKMTYFDFQMLQRQVVHRFISGKPIIKAQMPAVRLPLFLGF
ncbi:E3 ubiquitin-protein ligase RNF213-like isoform X4 [Pezoporus occidentalis]|uniref:E3 ubiquitin-protein ligase RNF213-like isoform X4 n=1 Tax=Pezoporus occidentalis TaxID=407982 RepID=UPI002F915B55